MHGTYNVKLKQKHQDLSAILKHYYIFVLPHKKKKHAHRYGRTKKHRKMRFTLKRLMMSAVTNLVYINGSVDEHGVSGT